MATLHKIDEIRKGPAREEVERLARQTGYVIAVAQKIYDAEYDKLSDAKVTDFCRGPCRSPHARTAACDAKEPPRYCRELELRAFFSLAALRARSSVTAWEYAWLAGVPGCAGIRRGFRCAWLRRSYHQRGIERGCQCGLAADKRVPRQAISLALAFWHQCQAFGRDREHVRITTECQRSLERPLEFGCHFAFIPVSCSLLSNGCVHQSRMGTRKRLLQIGNQLLRVFESHRKTQ